MYLFAAHLLQYQISLCLHLVSEQLKEAVGEKYLLHLPSVYGVKGLEEV